MELGARHALYGLAGLVVIGAASFAWWTRSVRADARAQGQAACAASGKDAAWCEERAKEYGDRCFDLTFHAGGRFQKSSLDTQGYAECLELGDDAYWRKSAERAEEARHRREQNRSF